MYIVYNIKVYDTRDTLFELMIIVQNELYQVCNKQDHSDGSKCSVCS